MLHRNNSPLFVKLPVMVALVYAFVKSASSVESNTVHASVSCIRYRKYFCFLLNVDLASSTFLHRKSSYWSWWNTKIEVSI